MKKLSFLYLFFLAIFYNLFAETNTSMIKLLQNQKIEIEENLKKAKYKLNEINEKLRDENIWLKSYSNYLILIKLKEEIADLDFKILETQNEPDFRTRVEKTDKLRKQKENLKNQIELFGSSENAVFGNLLIPKELGEAPSISNPILIISGFSYIRQISQYSRDYDKKVSELNYTVKYLTEKLSLNTNILSLNENIIAKNRDILNKIEDKNSSDFKNISSEIETKTEFRESIKKEIEHLNLQLETFKISFETAKATSNVYKKRIDEIVLKLEHDITNQVENLITILLIVVGIIVFSFIFKWLIKRYIKDNEQVYTANKLVNFITIAIVTMILAFAYIANMDYLITVIGFASAGIAIAMKDIFMSNLGWFVIVFGGSIRVGDRVKVKKDGLIYVGDVLDISFLRITVHEDVTLTTYEDNRRAGRVIFIPNHYIFTSLIANYSHLTLKTVWDGIDISITFDSNHKKATHIMKEIAKNYSKGYTDMTRKQLNKLRDRYNLRNTNVEPRMFSFIEENGIKLSVWYLTNAYATLTLRSTISASIIDAFKPEEDITIAYPTQTIRFISEKDLTIENSVLDIHSHKKEQQLHSHQQQQEIQKNLENSLKDF